MGSFTNHVPTRELMQTMSIKVPQKNGTHPRWFKREKLMLGTSYKCVGRAEKKIGDSEAT